MESLTPEEELRYNRQIILKQFDFDGQETLKQSHVLIIGAGGLGCAASQYLCAAGIGAITLVDDDTVELSNLQRQVLHNDNTIGEFKVDSAAKALKQLNPHTHIFTVARRLDDDALDELIQKVTLVLDCSDNLDTRNQINRFCFKHKTPLVIGAAIRFEGQVAAFSYQADEPCYQCLSVLFGNVSLTCVESGILSPIVGIIGSMQALEAIKMICQLGSLLTYQLATFDALQNQWRTYKLSKQSHCPVCSQHID